MGVGVRSTGRARVGSGAGFRSCFRPCLFSRFLPQSTCEDRVLDGPASEERAPRVGISSTLFGVRAQGRAHISGETGLCSAQTVTDLYRGPSMSSWG